MTRTLTRPILSTPAARAVLAATTEDPLLHAAVSLMLLAGLRPSEARRLLVQDWQPGDDPKVVIRGKVADRTVRVARSTATAVYDCLIGEDTELDEPLLLGLHPQGFLERVFRDVAQEAGLEVAVHDLRRAAMAVVLEDGTPIQHVEAYFGLSMAPGRKDLVGVPDGYDVGIAAVLEAAFGAQA
jgi:integrase